MSYFADKRLLGFVQNVFDITDWKQLFGSEENIHCGREPRFGMNGTARPE